MRKFIYIGDEPSVFAFGLTFPKGAFVEVTDAHALKKLASHPHFRQADPALPVEAPEIGAALTQETVAPLVAPVSENGGQDEQPHTLETQFLPDAPNALLGQPKKRGRRK